MPGSSDPLDQLLTGALVVDGTGAEPYRGEIGIRGDTIAMVRPEHPPPAVPPVPPALATVDCAGLVLMPGFVDIHTHSDLSYLHDPLASSKVMQGVTTEVVGNCGFSAFPVAPARRGALGELLRGLGGPPVEIGWTDLAGYAEAVAARAPVTNVAPLVGHGALRIAAAGTAEVPAGRALLRELAALLAANLEQGAFGLSTGLTYVPSRFATPAEVHALAAVVARYGGLYATHARATGSTAGMVDEAIEVGRRTGVRVQFSHLALNDPRQWGSAGEVIGWFAAAVAAGVDVRYDVYPYDASASSLTQYLPGWVQEQGEDGLRELLDQPQPRARARTELARGLFGEIPWDWRRVVVSLAGPGDEELVGQSIEAAAARRQVPAEKLVLDLCARHGNTVQVVLFYRSEPDVAQFLAHPLAVVGSDGSALPPTAPGRPHPRSFGTYPRLLARYVREQRLLGLADAVHKATLAPARRLGLRHRGWIAAGARADLAAIDLSAVRETATWTRPCQLADGVRQVWVNGVPVVAGGRLTGARPGRVLRRDRD